MLKVVNITAKKIIPESKNLNGPGEADYIIDKKELEKAGKKSLNDLLQEKFPDFIVTGFTPPAREYRRPLNREEVKRIGQDLASLTDFEKKIATEAIGKNQHKPWRKSYTMRGQEVRFIVDGIDLDRSYDDRGELPPFDSKRFLFVKNFLDYTTAEDITGIELMLNLKYTGNYSRFEPNKDRMGRMGAFAYLEITTRTKQGPFNKFTPGTYLYKPIPFSLPKEFYSPKYTVKNKNIAVGADLRSTIFWEPNIITDKDGKATVSFYSADKRAKYNILIEGADLGGQIGLGKGQITIK